MIFQVSKSDSRSELFKQMFEYLNEKFHVCQREEEYYELTERRIEEVKTVTEVIVNQSTKENETMAQLLNPFDATQVDPAGTAPFFPVGTHKVVIVGNEVKATKDETGGLLELTLQIIEGEFTGLQAPYRLNLYNKSEKAVEIAYKQLSAICHVTGVYQVLNADVLMNIPFLAVVGLQKKVKADDPDYTEIKGVKDIHGNDPGKQGQPAQQQAANNFQTQQQPVQQQAQAGGWQQPVQQQPVQQQHPAQTGWNQPAQQQQNTGWQQPVQPAASGAPAWAQNK